jgi:hypothetical protein
VQEAATKSVFCHARLKLQPNLLPLRSVRFKEADYGLAGAGRHARPIIPFFMPIGLQIVRELRTPASAPRPSARVLARWPRYQQGLSFVVTLKAYCASGSAFHVLHVLGQAVPGISHHYEN